MRLLLALLLLLVPAAARAQSGNLIADGDASVARCEDDWSAVSTLPGWTVTQGAASAICAGFTGLTAASAVFANGPYGDSAFTQVISLSAAASAIDAGGMTYTLSGLLGGWQQAAGQALVTVTFLDGYDDPMPTPAQIGGVDAAARGGATALLPRSATGPVPPRARAALVQVKFAGTQPFANATFASNLSLTLSTPLPGSVAHRQLARVPAFDHVFLIMMENTDYAQVIGDTVNAPFINGLAAQGTLLAQAHGVYHPSDENYLALSGGDIFVHGAIYFPDIHVGARHIGDRLVAAGKTWRAYEQGMGAPCTLGASQDRNYAPDDAPFANFTSIQTHRGACVQHLVSQAVLARDLQSAAATPAFAWIAADYYFDGELPGNGSPKSLQVQDGYLKQVVGQIMASPAWTTQHSLLVLTWDESVTYGDNHVATILVGSPGTVRAGQVSALYADHYGTARTIEAALGIGPLTPNDSYARPYNEAFDSHTPQPSLTGPASVAHGANWVAAYGVPVAFLSVSNWVGVFPAGAAPDQAVPLLRQTVPATSGTAAFATAGLPAGTYDVWYGYDGGVRPLAGPVRVTVTP